MKKTLKELCKECGVSRRAVQGYERYGLVSPCDKTERGYLLYDDEAQKKVKRIKQLQNFGFTVKEIASFLEKDKPEQKKLLREKLSALYEKRKELERIIAEAEQIIGGYS